MSSYLSKSQKKELIKIARQGLNQFVSKKQIYAATTDDLELKKERGLFLTLRKNSNLRGCLGSIVARKPLYLEVRDMAIAAASQDSRFQPVLKSELNSINIEISVLSPLEEIDDVEKIELKKHGVMVKKGLKSGVFLPQVAVETGWGKEEFMNNLCEHKAGFLADSWKTKECQIFIFSSEVFDEKEQGL